MNLRAALLRYLDQAKKNGVLGRDAILRKTMLDECKGERLEEVLAVFSSAVLKKVVAEQQLNSREFPAVAHSLALEKRGYSGGRTELNVLILAHTVSLRRKLDQKNSARLRYSNFAKVLDSKQESIAGRIDHVKQSNSSSQVTSISDQQRTDVRRIVRNNWAGNERWMEALLYGDAFARQNGVLTSPFDRVWRRVHSDRVQELEDQANGLLKQLDDRVRVQQERLSKWHTLKRDMFGNTGGKPTIDSGAHTSRQKGLDFGFGVHESLHPGRLSPRKPARSTPSDSGSEYHRLVSGLERDLKAIDRVSTVPALLRLGRHAQPSKSPVQSEFGDKATDEPISELSELEEEIAKASEPPTMSTLSRGEKQESREPDMAAARLERAKRPRLPQPLSTMHAFRPKTKTTEISPTESSKPTSPPRPKGPSSPSRSPIFASKDACPSPVYSPTGSGPPSPSWSPPRRSPPRRTHSPKELPSSPTQQQADQILASMNATSPSPIKQSRPRPTLSLADRTRLSMSRSTTLDFDDDDDDDEEMPTGSSTRPRRRNTSSRSPKKRAPSTPTTVAEESASANDARGDEVAEEDDLVARTRKSMANFEAAQQKARLERQRSQKHAAKQSGPFARQKYFPAVGEEDESADGNSTEVLEELIAKEAENQGADYESIFKSRPKIKASPPGTPLRSGFSWDGED